MIDKTPSAGLSSSVKYEQSQLLFRFPLRLTTNALNASFVTAVAWGSFSSPMLLLWLAVTCAVTAGRYGLCRRFARARPTEDEITPWLRRFTLGSAVSGALWGAASAVLWLTPEITYHVFIAFVIAGMSAASVATNYSHLPSVHAFVLPAVVPLTIGFLFHAGFLHLSMGIMCALFLVFLLIHARMSNAALLNSLRLREENTALIADLSAARDRLEQRVSDRTSELETTNRVLQDEILAHAETGRRLLLAQKLKAVGQLTGGVAHDFNNLLAVIQGNAEFQLEAPDRDPDSMRRILRATARGAELTQRLLAFSRQQPLRPRSLDLTDLVETLTDLVRRTLGEAIEITTRADADLWYVKADPGQVENALLNLAINARDAMPEGGRLTIACRNARLDEAAVAGVPEASVGDYVELAVSDSGAGMSDEVRERAFEPFFTTKKIGEGSGLGLSMVYGFAQQSGGHVVIDSEPEQGCTVKFYLPRDETDTAQANAQEETSEPTGGGRLIMVIEDDTDLRKLVVRMLEGLAYRVIDVADAAQARELLTREQGIDLVLADVVLSGGTSGPAFAQEVQAFDSKIKIIFMSGYPIEAAERRAIVGSGQTLLSKPFHRAELASSLHAALDG